MINEQLASYAAQKKAMCLENDSITDRLFQEYGVYRGLRDDRGKGVLTGLTRISKIISAKNIDGVNSPCDGELWYRGYNINTLIAALGSTGFGFENTAYLLLFGKQAETEEAAEFCRMLADCRELPTFFTRDVIMKAPTRDIMNSMTKSILTLAAYDEKINDDSVENCIRQCMQLISVFPMLAVYAYHANNHYENNASMYVHRPLPQLSTAENILRMLRPDSSYTALEAKVLDVVLMLHMEHGGGNNSTFTTRVVTSSGTDTYSAIAAAMSSLKGPKHGGANIKVMDMMHDIRTHVADPNDREEVKAYLARILAGEAFDQKGLIYGMGHAIYSVSDPRERILKKYVLQLAAAKNEQERVGLYSIVEEEAPQLIANKRRTLKQVSPNVDFYSGFVYDMLGIPVELYTPLFAVARIVGWSAHRIEEIIGTNKIIRPAYMSVMEEIE